MYTNYFGLRAKPFGLAPDPRNFFESSRHRPVLEAALGALEEGRGMLVLTGPAGVGKSALARKLMGRLPQQIDAMFLQYTNLDLDGLLGMLIEELGLEQLGGPRLEQFAELRRGLAERSDAGEPVLLLVDEAQNLCAEALGVLLRLVRESREEGSAVQLMLVGQPELETTLRAAVIGRVPGAMPEWLRLEPLDAEDLGPIIQHRLQAAGCLRQDLFEPEAITRLYHHTGGNPRLLNRLCDQALLHAYTQRALTVSPEVVDRVANQRLEEPNAGDEASAPEAAAGVGARLRKLLDGTLGHVRDWLKQPLTDWVPRRRPRRQTETQGPSGRRRLSPADWVPLAAVGGGVLLLVLVLLAPKPELVAEEALAQSITEDSPLPANAAAVADSNVGAVTPPATTTVPAGGGLEEMSVSDMRAQLLDLHQALDRALSEREAMSLELEMVRTEREALLAQLAAERDDTGEALPAAESLASAAPVSVIVAPTRPAQPEPRAEPAPAAARPATYVARSGDTLWSIARAHELSLPELLALNGLSPDHMLRSGEKLVVTERSGDERPSAAGAEPTNQAPLRYTVRRGDTLYGISRRFKVSVGELSHWNDLSDETPLLAGQRLVVYAGAGV